MRRLRELPLVSQLVLVTLLLGSVTALLGAWVIRSSARAAIREEVEARNVGIAQRLATGVDDRVESSVELLRLLATNEEIVKLSDRAQTELYIALRSSRPLAHLILLDEDGRAVAAAAEETLIDPGSEAPRPQLVAALEAGSHSVETSVGDTPRLQIAVPIEDPPGSVAGALVLELPLEDAAGRVDARVLDPNVTAFVTNEDGRILVHQERDRVIREEHYDLAPLTSSRTRATSTVNGDGERTLAAVAEISAFPGLVVVEEPELTALAGASTAATQLTVILLLAVLLIVAGVSVLGRNLLHPLRPLQAAVDALGRGALEERVPEEGGSEIRALAADFNQMADILSDKIEELATSERRLHAILDATPAAVYLKDPSGRYLFVNRQFENRHNKRREAIVGKTDHDLFSAHVAAVSRANDVAVIEQGITMEREEVAIYQDEKRTYVSAKLPLYDSSGKIYAVCGISTDVTERKKVEAYQRQLDDARRRRLQALEINDNVIQGLAVALYSLDLRRPAEAQQAVEDTLAAARSMINDLLEDIPDADWGPGDFVRSQPAAFDEPINRTGLE